MITLSYGAGANADAIAWLNECIVILGKRRIAQDVQPIVQARDIRVEIERFLMDFEVIKIGMTREQIGNKFSLDGGMHSVTSVIFQRPECGYLKIAVDFDSERYPDGQGRATMSQADRAISVGKPYIERPNID